MDFYILTCAPDHSEMISIIINRRLGGHINNDERPKPFGGNRVRMHIPNSNDVRHSRLAAGLT